jgi:hypothetical protein
MCFHQSWDFGTAISAGQSRDEAASGDAPVRHTFPIFAIHCDTISDCKANMNVSIDSLSRSLMPRSAAL